MAASGIILHILLVGSNAAVVRAAILGMLALLGHQLSCRQVGLNSLAFVAAGMAFYSARVQLLIIFDVQDVQVGGTV